MNAREQAAARLHEEIEAIREAIDHTEHGPLWDPECQEDLARLRHALNAHERDGCPNPGKCVHEWAAGEINRYCRGVLGDQGEPALTQPWKEAL